MDVTPRIRPGSIPIVRFASADGPLYTVPTGRRCVITHAWIAGVTHGIIVNPGAVAGQGIVTDAGTLRAIVGCSATATAVSLSNLDIPLLSGTVVALGGAGAASGGFTGYEYTPTGPEEV